ncbi:MAG: hypothetical protein ABEJ85_01405 [Haloarculaceae archaeon]
MAHPGGTGWARGQGGTAAALALAFSRSLAGGDHGRSAAIDRTDGPTALCYWAGSASGDGPRAA